MIEKATVSEKNNAYWDQFYSYKNVPNNPSSFAKLIIDKIDKSKTLLELGCGNGRDSFFFARNNINTVGVDLSQEAINNNICLNHDNVEFKHSDFTELDKYVFQNIGSIYSRFTLHSVDKKSYIKTIDWCGENIDQGGKFFIEARSTNDPFYGVGTKRPDNAYITTHYRRFFKVKDVIKDLEERDFEISYAVEDYVDSWYKEDYAVVMRIICRKK